MDAATTSLRPSPGQRALADALARGEAALGERMLELPASLYTDAERFEAERRELFGKLPLVLAPSALLPGNKLAVAHDGFGVPLIISRDAQDAVHVMANVCRHRGTRLIESDDVVPAKGIACPYHAWTYGPDGTLRGVPRADCFPGLNKREKSLVQFQSTETGGLIWFTRGENSDFAGAHALAADFDAFGMAGLHLTGGAFTRLRRTGSC